MFTRQVHGDFPTQNSKQSLDCDYRRKQYVQPKQCRNEPKHGDIVAIDRTINDFKDDGIYAFVYEGKARIKRLQYLSGYRLKVISDNPSYDPEILEKDQVEQIHFVGKLIKKLTLDIVDL
ncbi:hypothetical protein A6J76_011315 [Aggregatibacter aphrophilus]|nr:hypothetical protein A6J76_011315 [Aggregatibacter aphrophilus]